MTKPPDLVEATARAICDVLYERCDEQERKETFSSLRQQFEKEARAAIRTVLLTMVLDSTRPQKHYGPLFAEFVRQFADSHGIDLTEKG